MEASSASAALELHVVAVVFCAQISLNIQFLVLKPLEQSVSVVLLSHFVLLMYVAG